MSGDRAITVMDVDKIMAAEALKCMPDQKSDWTSSSGNNTSCGCNGTDRVSI